VTHRGVSTGFLVVSGHDDSSFTAATAGLAPNRITLVVLMGLGRASDIAWNLLNNCWSRGTPVAVITDASTPRQHVWRGTLDDLASGQHALDGATASPAGTIVVGDVVTVNMQAALDQAVACGS
jgi:uroporphyrin-III C-methyltransferase/precorrin-2 dehydrogenase/sirohydrochlorin ferrochelatase